MGCALGTNATFIKSAVLFWFMQKMVPVALLDPPTVYNNVREPADGNISANVGVSDMLGIYQPVDLAKSNSDIPICLIWRLNTVSMKILIPACCNDLQK